MAEESFDKKSVLGMDYQTVIHTICFIEQQLLLEDHSSSIHDPESLKDEVKRKLENENVRSLTLPTNDIGSIPTGIYISKLLHETIV